MFISTRVEEAEVLDALARAAQQRGVEGIALVDPELAADHLVERAQIADDVDALDIDPRALVDHVVEVDRALGVVLARGTGSTSTKA